MRISVAIASENALPSAFVVLRGLESSVKKASELGYDGVELALKEPNEISRQELSSILKQNGIEVSAISSGQVYAARGLMFTDEDKEKRSELEKSFKGFIDLASDFGSLVNIGRVRGSINGRDKEYCEKLFLDMAHRLCDYAEKRGVTLILEPVNRYEIDYVNNLDEGARLVEKVGRKNFSMMPDVFHMNIEDSNIGESLIRNKEYVKYIHLADSNRWAPGDGHLDFDDIFSALLKMKYDGWCTVECLPFPSAETAARRAIDFLRNRYI